MFGSWSFICPHAIGAGVRRPDPPLVETAPASKRAPSIWPTHLRRFVISRDADTGQTQAKLSLKLLNRGENLQLSSSHFLLVTTRRNGLTIAYRNASAYCRGWFIQGHYFIGNVNWGGKKKV